MNVTSTTAVPEYYQAPLDLQTVESASILSLCYLAVRKAYNYSLTLLGTILAATNVFKWSVQAKLANILIEKGRGLPETDTEKNLLEQPKVKVISWQVDTRSPTLSERISLLRSPTLSEKISIVVCLLVFGIPQLPFEVRRYLLGKVISVLSYFDTDPETASVADPVQCAAMIGFPENFKSAEKVFQCFEKDFLFDFSSKNLRKIWRHIAKAYHPDKGGTDEVSAIINRAFDILKETPSMEHAKNLEVQSMLQCILKHYDETLGFYDARRRNAKSVVDLCTELKPCKDSWAGMVGEWLKVEKLYMDIRATIKVDPDRSTGLYGLLRRVYVRYPC